MDIIRTNEEKGKDPEISSFKYTIGNETQYKIKSGIFTITSTLNSGKQTFKIKETLVSEKNGSKPEYTRITTYTLAAKGEILSIITDEVSPNGSAILKEHAHTEMIYNRL